MALRNGALAVVLGVGLGLLIASDIVYVADTAKIGSPFKNLGATLDSGGHALFVERLGAHRTMDLIVTGRLMSGAEAVAAGLFSQVFPADEVTDATRAAARAARPSSPIHAAKTGFRRKPPERLRWIAATRAMSSRT